MNTDLAFFTHRPSHTRTGVRMSLCHHAPCLTPPSQHIRAKCEYTPHHITLHPAARIVIQLDSQLFQLAYLPTVQPYGKDMAPNVFPLDHTPNFRRRAQPPLLYESSVCLQQTHSSSNHRVLALSASRKMSTGLNHIVTLACKNIYGVSTKTNRHVPHAPHQVHMTAPDS